MNIDERIRNLKRALDKSASIIPKLPKNNIPKTPSSKLQGPNKPPKLTSDSQPVMDINQAGGLATLPKMRTNGRDPSFTSEMKDQNPYQKK